MQHVTALRPVSTVASKAAALAAYDAAMLSPIGADWQSVAHMLRAALPASKAKAEASNAVPAWFADYKLPKDYTRESTLVTFADGEAVRCNIHSAGKKLPRVAKACRVAIEFYRARTGAEDVPAIASIENLSTGQAWDAAECSRLTADFRKPRPSPVPAPRPVTAEAVERMELELARRERGLDLAQRGDASVECDASAWQAAVNSAREELARMRAALTPTDPAPRGTKQHEAAAPEPVQSSPDYSETIPEPIEAIEAAAPEPIETHTIVAVCTSHRGRGKLFDRLQDGCFPDARGHGTLHGAYRITLADAQEIGPINGVRYVGLPRKPRTVAAAAPLAMAA